MAKKSLCGRNGITPNLGANDGARLFQLSDEPFEDFRPTILMAEYYFGAGISYDTGVRDFAWYQRNKKTTERYAEKTSKVFPNFGLAVLHNNRVDVFIRFANFKFRPSQADCLHVDLFVGGRNVFGDAGSYSYHEHEHNYFSGTEYHNTIVFDGHDQMPRVGKFLFGKWIEMDEVGAIQGGGPNASWAGQYTDTHGNRHRREVDIDLKCLRVSDRLSGPYKSATLSWHLDNSSWILTESGARSSEVDVSIQTSGSRVIELDEGWRSKRYQLKQVVPVLRVKLDPQCRDIRTTVKLLA